MAIGGRKLSKGFGNTALVYPTATQPEKLKMLQRQLSERIKGWECKPDKERLKEVSMFKFREMEITGRHKNGFHKGKEEKLPCLPLEI